MKFNERLLDLRKKKGWSQEELGYKLDVSRQTVSKWEAGQTTPELEKLRKLSQVFEISLDELINEDEISNEDLLNKTKVKNKHSKKFKIIRNIFCIIIFSIIILYIILVLQRVSIIRNIEKILLETLHKYKYLTIQEYKYEGKDTLFAGDSRYLNFQFYDTGDKIVEKAEISEDFSGEYERITYYESYYKDNGTVDYQVKVNETNQTYYLNSYERPFEHNCAVYNIELFREYQKNYNEHIEKLDIDDFILAMNLKIKIAKVDNGSMKGYYLSNRNASYQNYCDIIVDTLAETICLENVIYNEKSKDTEYVERYRYKYDEDYVLLEEIQVPDLTNYTLSEYVEK